VVVALFGTGPLKLSDLADAQLQELVFGLQPIVKVMPRLAVMLKKEVMGHATDLLFGGTIELHITFRLLSILTDASRARRAKLCFLGPFNISLIREKPSCFGKYFPSPLLLAAGCRRTFLENSGS
jgi:hypothetical protein